MPPGVSGHGRGGGSALPVLVMIHGGGLTTGAGDQHDGSLIVPTDLIIVVSINYRLGPFGFLTCPGLARRCRPRTATRPPRPGGRAALGAAQRRRLRREPGQGHDRGRVRGRLVGCALLTSLLARGLFRAVIMESGSGSAPQSPAAAEVASLAFAKQAGFRQDPATAAACLRALPETTLLRAIASYQPESTTAARSCPCADASAVAAGDSTRAGAHGHEPRRGPHVLAGAHRPAPRRRPTRGSARSTARGARDPRRYPWSSYAATYTAAYLIGDIWTDSGFLDRDRRVPHGEPGQPVCGHDADVLLPVRRPARSRAQQRLPRVPRGVARDGAGQPVAELQHGYSCTTGLHRPSSELSRQMVRYWGAFVTTGRPEVPRRQLAALSSGELMSCGAGTRPRRSAPLPSAPSTSAPSGTPASQVKAGQLRPGGHAEFRVRLVQVMADRAGAED